ncbi:DUF2306 domain-containing protein [Bacillus sp. SCS-153A]|uniref:DUF2306 domain-containing protein n=1 Tax=Rossellomorea sedimentorum TaxID=3115294 RepID=UPI003905C0B0
MFTWLLIIHIAAGIICLISGVVAMISKKRRGEHTISGEVYHLFYVFVFLTAVAMSILHWEESAYLFYIAVFSYGLALSGYLAGKFRWKNWLRTHIGGMLGSYIGIVTATIVVNVPKVPLLNELPVLIFWFFPTIIGTPLIFKISSQMTPSKPNRVSVKH